MRTDVSLARIAEVSGRSESTVSRVLRRAPGVSAEARRAVEVALRTLGVSGAEAAPSDRGIIAVVQAVVLGADVDAFESLFLEMLSLIHI